QVAGPRNQATPEPPAAALAAGEAGQHAAGNCELVMRVGPLECDRIVLGMMLRFLVGGGGRSWVFRLLVMSLIAFLSADLGWAVLMQLGGTSGPIAQHLLEMASLSAFALIGAAALHPSAAAVVQPQVEKRRTMSRFLFVGRSAIIDRWFRRFDEPLPVAEYIKEFDPDFAASFALGHEALRDDFMPAEICLA